MNEQTSLGVYANTIDVPSSISEFDLVETDTREAEYTARYGHLYIVQYQDDKVTVHFTVVSDSVEIHDSFETELEKLEESIEEMVSHFAGGNDE